MYQRYRKKKQQLIQTISDDSLSKYLANFRKRATHMNSYTLITLKIYLWHIKTTKTSQKKFDIISEKPARNSAKEKAT